MMEKMLDSKYYIDLMTYKGELIYRGYASSTYRIYMDTLQEFLEYTDKEIIDIHREDVIRYLDHKLEENMSSNTILIKLNALELFFEDMLGLDITLHIDKYERQYTRHLMTMREINTVIELSAERERVMYNLMREVGMTSEETGKVKVKALKTEGNKWYLEIEGRKYEISLHMARMLLNYIEKHRLKENIFVSSRGTGLHGTVIRKKFRENTGIFLGKVYGLDEFRHSIALEMWRRGEIEKACKYLRNESKGSVKQYYDRYGYDLKY